MKNKLVSFLVAVCVSVSLFACVPSFAAANKPSFQEVANGIISWKKSDVGSSSDGVLMNGKYLELAGTTPGIGTLSGFRGSMSRTLTTNILPFCATV